MLNANVIPSRAKLRQWGGAKKYSMEEISKTGNKNKTANKKTKAKSQGWLRLGRLGRIMNRNTVKK